MTKGPETWPTRESNRIGFGSRDKSRDRSDDDDDDDSLSNFSTEKPKRARRDFVPFFPIKIESRLLKIDGFGWAPPLPKVTEEIRASDDSYSTFVLNFVVVAFCSVLSAVTATRVGVAGNSVF
uniref:Uncharacterized protein n=1 Tax=Kalanchoe fedtschenkoi TaxID=63787 RepID=A0A7N0TMS7_KALFE